MTDEAEILPRASAVETIALGGLAVGLLDLLDAVAFYWFYYGVAPIRIFQAIAAGVLGRDGSREGGWNTAVLGIFLHFVIAALIATVFYIGTLKLPVLLRRPVISGLIYGVICYFVMSYVVVPLSNAPKSAFSLPPFINGVIGHALLVGLPVALIASWSAKRNSAG